MTYLLSITKVQRVKVSTVDYVSYNFSDGKIIVTSFQPHSTSNLINIVSMLGIKSYFSSINEFKGQSLIYMG